MLEGGDMLVIGNGCVLVGMGERTRPVAVEQIAQRLFATGAATSVIAVVMPKLRSAMHLDTVMTMVDRDAFTIYPGLKDALTGYRLEPRDDAGVKVEREPDLFAAIARALDLPSLRLIATGGDHFEAEREQWDDGNNVLAIAPGVVVAYERNVDTNDTPDRGRRRGHHHHRLGARPGPRRPTLHVVPDRARPSPSAGREHPAMITPNQTSAAATTAPSDLLRISELDARQLYVLLDLAAEMKAAPHGWETALHGDTVAMFFEKPSTRTRVSFAAAASTSARFRSCLRPDELQLGRGEPISDTARVALGLRERHRRPNVRPGGGRRDGRGGRDAGHQRPHRRPSSLPGAGRPPDHPGAVWEPPGSRALAYIGDGNNVAHSLMEAGALAGMHVVVGTPQGFEPDPAITDQAAATAHRARRQHLGRARSARGGRRRQCRLHRRVGVDGR